MQPDEAPLVTMTTSLEEGVYTVSVPRVGSGENANDYGDNEMDNVVYLIRIQDQFGNETYFPMVKKFIYTLHLILLTITIIVIMMKDYLLYKK